ncbi:MAG: NAD-dependent epimerase/dehydratase family protein, partial [Bacteroidetes bacterium]|nr:NAD-dependent epimerase/dehydratase family protein [Bacteroidota bacterium]
PYAKSKIQAEKLLVKWSKKQHVKMGILRLPLVVGKNPPGNLGSMIRAIKSGKYFRIGQGESRKSMVVIEDVTKCIPKLAEVGGIFNLTDGYHPSFQEIEDTIASVIGKKILNIPYPLAKVLALIGDMTGDVFPLNSGTLTKITKTLTYSDTRAREKLDWDPQPALTYLKEIVH